MARERGWGVAREEGEWPWREEGGVAKERGRGSGQGEREGEWPGREEGGDERDKGKEESISSSEKGVANSLT